MANYELPDGSQVQCSSFERQYLPEQLFVPTSSDSTSNFPGIPHMILESISKSDIDIRRELFLNIILSGGTAMLKGFQERTSKVLPDISPQNAKVKVLSGNDRRFQPWMGGSILSSLGSFQQMWMSRQEYEEHGAIMIERKCP